MNKMLLFSCFRLVSPFQREKRAEGASARDLMMWSCILNVFLMIENYREKMSDCFSRRTVWVLPDAVMRVSR